MERLQDRVAVITGAGSGIGLASARRLAAEGALVVAVDIDETAGKAAAAAVSGEFIAADVASEDDVRRLYDTVMAARAGGHRVPQRGDLSPGR
jgi:NAD(P)-dependent dehydrogenase (short-subunit alcohol dehydrogenase family)